MDSERRVRSHTFDRRLAEVEVRREQRSERDDAQRYLDREVDEVFTARYRGECAECDEPIMPGDLVRRVEGNRRHYAHAVCPVAVAPAEVTPDEAARGVCTRCWLYHPGECL